MRADVETVRAQLGREPLPFLGVAARCEAGRPVVVEQPSRLPDGRPFPTTFWLTCPGLVRRIDDLESAGGVAALERRLRVEPALAAAFAAGRRRQIALRPELGPLGVGGTHAAGAVKCLHAHAAFALGSPPYPPGEEILAAAGGVPSPCCMGAAP